MQTNSVNARQDKLQATMAPLTFMIMTIQSSATSSTLTQRNPEDPIPETPLESRKHATRKLNRPLGYIVAPHF